MKTRILVLLSILFCGMTYAQESASYFDQNFGEPVIGEDNVTIECVIFIDGVQITAENYDVYDWEIASFSVDENIHRGTGWVKNWHNNGYFGSMFACGGESEEEITFKLYNHNTAETSDDMELVCADDFVFVANSTIGAPTTPYRINFVSTPKTCTFSNSFDPNTETYDYNWSNQNNWSPRKPVLLDDDAIISNNCICVIDDGVAGISYKTLTIKDGGQFVGDGEEYEVIFEKEIAAYTPNKKNNYYFIANPTDGELQDIENIFSENYDLYFWDATGLSEDGEETMEWQNYESYMYQDPDGEEFYTDDGGYLYANDHSITLKFSGVANQDETFTTNSLSNAGDNFKGFHLLGNPLTTNALVSGGDHVSGFYTINELRDEVVTAPNPIVVAPCTALFAVADGKTASKRKVTFSSYIEGTINTRSTTSLVNIEIFNSENMLDRACVRFNEQENLQKFTLNPEATHIFFREDGKDYAIVQGNERMSQLPLFFETREYGQYTINVKLENMSCEYLHLIDNMTGADIDLNATPSYTFQANSSDYAARFKIVFEGTGVEENTATENFAIVEGNRIVIPVIEHESTLEVIDMTGRTVSSQKVNGSFDHTLNVKAGIYMLRLNGMIQKIVIE